MKDFLGNELHVGDEVVYKSILIGNLNRGIITKIKGKVITIKKGMFSSHQFADQIVKIPVDKLAD